VQAFSALCFLKTALLTTEIGRTTHALIQENPVPMVADDPPKNAAIKQLSAGDTPTQDRA
jgi:hypothetical protein|tara:strand:+ start:251 stop:430 length:180 start_codon:yes stop_codon:yes gene_type:complete